MLPNPLEQLKVWITEADEAGVYEPNAMVLSTIDPDGNPSSRTVLLRGVDETGLYFYTDYGSRKGLALLAHSAVSLVFPWYLPTSPGQGFWSRTCPRKRKYLMRTSPHGRGIPK